jgi:hypothetical protein
VKVGCQGALSRAAYASTSIDLCVLRHQIFYRGVASSDDVWLRGRQTSGSKKREARRRNGAVEIGSLDHVVCGVGVAVATAVIAVVVAVVFIFAFGDNGVSDCNDRGLFPLPLLSPPPPFNIAIIKQVVEHLREVLNSACDKAAWQGKDRCTEHDVLLCVKHDEKRYKKVTHLIEMHELVEKEVAHNATQAKQYLLTVLLLLLQLLILVIVVVVVLLLMVVLLLRLPLL